MRWLLLAVLVLGLAVGSTPISAKREAWAELRRLNWKVHRFCVRWGLMECERCAAER